MIGVIFFGLTIPLSALRSDRYGHAHHHGHRHRADQPLRLHHGAAFAAGTAGVLGFLIIGFGLMGVTYGPSARFLPNPSRLRRYTGASLAFNLAGTGRVACPRIATWLATDYGFAYVGYYMVAAAIILADRLLSS